MAHWMEALFSFILKLSRLSTRLLTSKGIMNINSIDMVWLLIVKLTAILSTKVAKVSNFIYRYRYRYRGKSLFTYRLLTELKIPLPYISAWTLNLAHQFHLWKHCFPCWDMNEILVFVTWSRCLPVTKTLKLMMSDKFGGIR